MEAIGVQIIANSFFLEKEVAVLGSQFMKIMKIELQKHQQEATISTNHINKTRANNQSRQGEQILKEEFHLFSSLSPCPVPRIARLQG